MQLLHTLCRRIGNFVLLFGAMPDLHYINGPDTLPPPLTPQEEQQALCGLAAGEGAARDALITQTCAWSFKLPKNLNPPPLGWRI